MRNAAFGVVVALILCPLVQSQDISTVSGTVSDPSGAVIPQAKIAATELDTGLTRNTISNSEGLYVLTSLRPTRYTLTAEAQGFRQFKQTDLLLQAGDTLTINIKLVVGASYETVTVEASAVQVDTSSATLKQVVDSARMVDLPLNGRNAAALTTLVAGAVYAPNINADEGPAKTFPASVIPISVNGGRANNVAFALDGMSAVDVLTLANQPFPFPDALQEFNFQTSNFSAEYGENSSGVVSVVTKSGTNAFHGDVFEFLRNANIDARNFFSATPDPLHRNQFGGTIGGPILKDKLFFFGGYQATIIRDSLGGLGQYVPTAAEIAGDFSNLLGATNPANPLGRAIVVKDPNNGNLPFPNNQIPVSRFDRTSQGLLKYLPTSPSPTGLVFYSEPTHQNFNEYIARVDYSLSTADRLTYRINEDFFSTPAVLVPGNILTYNFGDNDRSLNTVLGETHIFSPNLLNDFRFGATYIHTTRDNPTTSPSLADLGSQIPWEAPVKGNDGFTVNGYFSFGANGQAEFGRATFNFYDTVRWTKGRHTFAFGGALERDRLNQFSLLKQNPALSFTGNTTGSSIADFYLGRLGTFAQGMGSFVADRNLSPSLFVQDTFKVSSRLTLSYGLRWEPSLPWHDLFHQAEVFSPLLYQEGVKSTVFPNAPPGELFSGDAGVPPDGRANSWNNFTPRFGVAYDPFGDGKTSIRAGAGMFQDAKNTGYSNNSQVQSTPFSPQFSTTNQGTLTNPYLGVVDPFPFPRPSTASFVFPTPINVNSWDAGHYKIQVPNVYNWNLAIERQLKSSWLVRAAYVGSRSNHLMESEQLNASIYVSGATAASDQARRPYQPFGSVVQGTASGNAWYNGMQLTLEKRLSHGFTILANYTFAKTTDNIPVAADVSSPMLAAQITMPYNIPNFKSLDQGPSDFDVRHNFVVSYVWQLPGLLHANRLLRQAAGGWVISGVTTAQSGLPLTLFAGTDQSLTNIGKDSVNVVSQNFYRSGPCANVAPCVNWLVPSSFALPALGSFGDLGKGRLRGPGLFSTDAAVYKIFAVSERLNVQFRAEFFNVFNRANFYTPAAAPGTGVSPGVTGDPLNAAGFGDLLSARDPRIGQLALKVIF